MTGRTRLPPTSSEYRTDVAWPWSSGQRSSRSSASSTSPFSSSGLCIGPPRPAEGGPVFTAGHRRLRRRCFQRRSLRLLELVLDRFRKLGELAEELDRPLRRALALRQLLELGARGLEPLQQLLRPRQRLVSAHAQPSRESRSP